ncbi:hypothetical protein HHK36_001256 [Tetracentron sinense]|uniref:glucose-6-phosphate 1-epimerase n=1 Tax=Tetracentron sinense TaxID=13715 RepID=A0A834ZX02_TETSI|nr:hypothetical protein HHK36_001256 [Tetracentron sinense]
MQGGIPICFPQFGNCGSLEQHGFARNKIWTIDDNPPPLHTNDSKGKAYIDLLLKPSEEDLKCWPHWTACGLLSSRWSHPVLSPALTMHADIDLRSCLHVWWSVLYLLCQNSDVLLTDHVLFSFEFRLRVSLSSDGDLTIISRIRNINGKPFNFSFAYHTYLSISDISEVRIEGLETLDYLDNLYQRERFTEQDDAVTFESEVDRVYLSSPNVIAVLDHERKRTFVIRKDGLPDVVVWNPWEKKSKTMVDFGDEEYKQMLCVDGAVIERPIPLRPGEEWTGRVELSVVPSSYCSEPLDSQHRGL